jgi:hypothetical protein
MRRPTVAIRIGTGLVDKEVIAWLKNRPKATPEQFEAYLREIYRRPDMLERFPRGF